MIRRTPPASCLSERGSHPAGTSRSCPGPVRGSTPTTSPSSARSCLSWEYARLHLNQRTASADRLTTVDDLAACVGPLPYNDRFAGRYALGVDLATKHDRTVVAVLHVEPGSAGPPPPRPPGLDGDIDPGIAGEWRRRAREAGFLGPETEPPPQRVVLDRMGVWQGSRANPLKLQVVEDFIAEVSERYGRPTVLFDPYRPPA